MTIDQTIRLATCSIEHEAWKLVKFDFGDKIKIMNNFECLRMFGNYLYTLNQYLNTNV